MGSGISNNRKKFRLPGKSDSKPINKTDQQCHLIRHTTVTEKAATIDSTDSKEKDLEPGMDAEGDICNNNNNNNANASSSEANTINQDGEVCTRLSNKSSADNIDSTHENKDKGQCNDSVNPSPGDSTYNNVNTNSGNKYEDTNAEINETTQSSSNEVNIKHSSEVKTGHESVSKSGQICDKVDDSPSNEGVEPTNQEVTDSLGGGDNTAEIDTKETSEHSDKENTLNNIEQSNSDNVSIVSSSDATRNNSAQEPPSPPNSNESTENTETSTDKATGKPTNEKDKNDSAASNTGGNKQTELEYRLNENLQFYRNELYSKPFPGAKIEEMLEWKGDYLKLERTHSYIQWLFPIPESRGMNYSAQPLQEHEAQAISEDESLRDKVLEAFKMMLDFYGMELELEPLTFKRGDNWEERYEHLNRSIHNHFRITRIIKALGELGWQHLQKPWLEFMIHEATINQVLPKLNKDSTMCHFIDGLKDVEDQGKIYHLIADLNDQLQKNAADVSKNDGKDASDRSGKTDEGNEDNSSSDDKEKGSTESTKEISDKDGKEMKEDKVMNNRNPDIDKEDADQHGSANNEEVSGTCNTGDLTDELKTNVVVETDKQDKTKSNQNENANLERFTDENDTLEKGSENHGAADPEYFTNSEEQITESSKDGGVMIEVPDDNGANEHVSNHGKNEEDESTKSREDTNPRDKSVKGSNDCSNNKQDSEHTVQNSDHGKSDKHMEESSN